MRLAINVPVISWYCHQAELSHAVRSQNLSLSRPWNHFPGVSAHFILFFPISLPLFFCQSVSLDPFFRCWEEANKMECVAIRWGIDIAACSCFSHIKRDYQKENEERTSHFLSIHGGKKRRRGSFTELTRDWRVSKRCAGIEHTCSCISIHECNSVHGNINTCMALQLLQVWVIY